MTKEQLEKLSDFEINKLVASKVSFHPCRWIEYEDDMVLICQKAINAPDHCVDSEVLDYCNNWSDMGPLMDSSMISTECHGHGGFPLVYGYCESGRYECLHKNPLRAAAIVYLLMQEK